MQLVLLVTKEMKPLPEGVKELMNFDRVTARFEGIDDHPTRYIVGEHMIVEGETEVIKSWLRPFDEVAVGVGAPQLQQFEIAHIKD